MWGEGVVKGVKEFDGRLDVVEKGIVWWVVVDRLGGRVERGKV